MKEKFSFLTKKPFAHRGFHSGFTKEKGSIPENSLAAFMLAIEKKFSIEMDIHFTKDFNIIVFHDFFLGRLTTERGYVFNKNINYINKAKLSNGESVPTLEEVLNFIEGRVPVLLEIKYSKFTEKNLKIFSNVLSQKLCRYDGPLALMSFNLKFMKFLNKKKFFRRFPLGLTTDFPLEDSFSKNIKYDKIEDEIVANKFQFISQNWKGIKNIRIKRLKNLGVAILSWTITSKIIERELDGLADNITFEQYEPTIRS